MPRPAWDSQFREPVEERAERLRASYRRQQKQATCKHVYQTVNGTTAYLQCPKCGLRESGMGAKNA